MTLLFIYNAKSGAINTVFDIAHKIISPNTYDCSLCAMTHDTFSENKLWKSFREAASIHMEFFHLDEFEENYQYPVEAYPIILLKKDNDLSVFMNTKEIKEMGTVVDLIETIKTKIRVVH